MFSRKLVVTVALCMAVPSSAFTCSPAGASCLSLRQGGPALRTQRGPVCQLQAHNQEEGRKSAGMLEQNVKAMAVACFAPLLLAFSAPPSASALDLPVRMETGALAGGQERLQDGLLKGAGEQMYVLASEEGEEHKLVGDYLPYEKWKEGASSQEMRERVVGLLKLAAIWSPLLGLAAYLAQDVYHTDIFKISATMFLILAVPVNILISGFLYPGANWAQIQNLLSWMVIWSPAVGIWAFTKALDALRAEAAGQELVDRR
mmetsp:Transcript_6537/g.14930  ORF Transcript_6537/g.14930 Transcript_6537/m.14930 type:complete len:260 (-) Transcript_6537:50-829(-)